MKIGTFLKNRAGELILLVALMIISIYSGVNFGILLSLALVFALLAAAAEMSKIGKTWHWVLQTGVILLIVGSIVGAYLPRATAKKGIARDYFDQAIASLMGDKTKKIAEDMFNIQKDSLGTIFLKHHNSLLSQGKPKEAQDTLNGWMRAWTFNREQEKKENIKSEPKAPEIVASSQVIAKDSIFTKGVYYIPVKGETPFTIHIKSSACGRYAMSSDKWNYDIAYNNNNSRLHDGPGVLYPVFKQDPQFRLHSPDDLVKLVVN
jgi:hypothetical protein